MEFSARTSLNWDVRAFYVGEDMTDTKPHRMAFLNRLYSALKERLASGGFLSSDEFADVFRAARGHAGGVAKAEKMLMMAEGDLTGCIVCLVPDAETAAALAVEGGLTPDQLHLTLCLFGDTNALGPVQRAEALLAIRDAAACCAPLAGEISGIGRFTNGEQDVIYASLDAPALSELQDHICDALEAAGFDIADDHGFTPHFTLAYVESGMPSPIEIVEARPVRFEAIGIWFGPEHISVPLLGIDMGGEPAEQDMPELAAMSELADLAATGHTHRLFNSIAFAEAPSWIPYLPKPGIYAHPRYGPITITKERNSRFVDNFAKRVYQDRLPIDAEHETKLSGAVGWITAMRQSEDGSAEARVEWTDRGKAFFAADRFRYFSPEWYDAWEDPATRTQYQDVAIGGALTTRPFFKDPALRPLFASERGLIVDDNDPSQGDTMDAQQFAELETKIKALETENATLKQTTEQERDQSKKLAEQVQRMAAERQTERFTALIRNDGARWFGEAPHHLSVLGTLAQSFGEDGAEFKAYVAQQQAVASALRTSNAFNELGGDGGGRTETDDEKLDRMAKERATANKITVAQAYTELLSENPSLYTA